MHIFDNSRLSDYKTCPRLYYYKHVLGWRRDAGSVALPLIFGKAWHRGLEYVWQHAGQSVDPSHLLDGAVNEFNQEWIESGLSPDLSLEQQEEYSPRTPGVGHEMLYNYINERSAILSNSRLIGNEQPFAVPMPFTEKTWYVGRMDKVIETNRDGRIVIEHKTTSAYSVKYNFQPSYIESWNTSAQVKGYEFAATLYYGEIAGVWVDAALVHKKIHNQFKFIPVMHQQVLVKEWLENTAQWIEEIKRNESQLDETKSIAGKPIFRKNEESCYGKYGECPFLDICRFTVAPSTSEVPPGYVVDKWEPFDEEELRKLVGESNG